MRGQPKAKIKNAALTRLSLYLLKKVILKIYPAFRLNIGTIIDFWFIL